MSNMHQGLDLSRFKKVSSDGKTTMLRHAKGHEIRIAHSGLTPAMKERLEALEMHGGGKVQRYAEGTPDEPVEAADEDSPEVAADTPQDAPGQDSRDLSQAPLPEGAAPEPEEVAPEPLAEQPAKAAPPKPLAAPTADQGAPPAVAPAAAAPQPQAAPQPAAPQPDPNVVDVVGQRTPQRADIAQQMNQHDLEVQHDFQKGYIKPETYGSLFAKKDTLGKIGTFFGLLLAGAGSGLAHQPNSILEMMDKQIKNDLEAQKATNENARSFYRLSLEKERNQAEIAKTVAETGKVPSEIDVNTATAGNIKGKTGMQSAEVANINADTQLKASTSAINIARLAAVQSFQGTVNNMPPGPGKDAAQAQVDAVSQAVTAQNAADNNATAQKIQLRNAAQQGAAAQAAKESGVDMGMYEHILKQSRANEALGAPALLSSSDQEGLKNEITKVEDNRAVAKLYDRAFKRLDAAKLANTLNPQLRAAEMKTLGAEIERATTGRFSATTAEGQADAMFPSAKDYGKARPQKYRNAMEHFEASEAGTTILNRFPGLKRPFPFRAAEEKDGTVKKSASGKPMIYTGGKWMYKK